MKINNAILGVTLISVMIAAVIFSLSAFGVIGLQAAPSGTSTTNIYQQGGQQQGGGTGTGTGIFCPDTGRTATYIRLQDEKAATTTYVNNANVYFVNMETDGVEANYTTSNAGTGYVNSANLRCGKTYKVYITTTLESAGGVFAEEITPSGSDVYYTYKTNQIDFTNVRVKDIDTDTYKSMIANGSTSGTNQTTFLELNDTNIYDDSSATRIAVGQDGHLNYMIYLQGNTARKFLGDKSGSCYAFVDVGSDNNWQEPTMTFNGKGLTNIISSVNGEDKLWSEISAADYAYLLGDGLSLSNSISSLQFYILTRSGINPDSSNDDIVLTIACEGIYKSSKYIDTFLKGIATDAATKVGVSLNNYVGNLNIRVS